MSSGPRVGIELPTPKGKHNGTVERHSYFECEENHGLLVRQLGTLFWTISHEWFLLFSTSHAPCNMLYYVRALIGC